MTNVKGNDVNKEHAISTKNITEQHAFRCGSIIVWAGISLGYRTDLHIFKRGSVTAARYRDEVLETIRTSQPGASLVAPGFEATTTESTSSKSSRLRPVHYCDHDREEKNELFPRAGYPTQMILRATSEEHYNLAGRT
ncbi:hypothetical protein TNCV_2981991 [Trichonephila clavipes]|nr:hypothetical protein TNCV_2981991 [Trichonephila clavipes]